MHGKLYFNFSAEKNQFLIKQRGISAEQVIIAIESGGLLDILVTYQ